MQIPTPQELVNEIKVDLLQESIKNNHKANKIYLEDKPIHDWYRFVLSFPPHIVRHYIDRFQLDSNSTVLDPFCGTGTMLVECKKNGVKSVGIEAHPLAYLASKVKLDWTPDPSGLIKHATKIAQDAKEELLSQSITDIPYSEAKLSKKTKLMTLSEDLQKLLLKNSISDLPLHKTLVLLKHIEANQNKKYIEHEKIALAKALVYSISNLHFGPEVGIGKIKADSPVISTWLEGVQTMAGDLKEVSELKEVSGIVYEEDSRNLINLLPPQSIDAVITSPPYPNEKDYTRTTRLESIILGLIKDKAELQRVKKGLIRSNTRGVYKGDDDDQWINNNEEIQQLAIDIEKRRIELGKTSGFEKMYARVTKLYFGGMAKHLADLRTILKPGAQLAYVVGDQASYLRVMIRTGKILGDIAVELGYEVQGIDLFRTRIATATKAQLREEVLLLKWNG